MDGFSEHQHMLKHQCGMTGPKCVSHVCIGRWKLQILGLSKVYPLKPLTTPCTP